MKLIKMICLITAVMLGPLANAVQNAAKIYTETYFCEVTTRDKGKHEITIEWSAKASEWARFPTWENSLVVDVKNIETQKEELPGIGWTEGSFSSGVKFNFELSKYTMSGFEHRCLRPGCFSKSIFVEILSNVDDLGSSTLTLLKFEYDYQGEDYYNKKSSFHMEFENANCIKK